MSQINRQSIKPISVLKLFIINVFSYIVGSLGLVARLHGGRTIELSSSLLSFSPPAVLEEGVVIYQKYNVYARDSMLDKSCIKEI